MLHYAKQLLTPFLAASGLAGVQAATPTPPTLTYLYSLNCTLGTSINVGTGPHGTRTVIPITGGTFAGPRLSGERPAVRKPRPY